MGLVVTPESGVPLPQEGAPLNISSTLEAARLACHTAALLDQSDGWGDLIDEDANIDLAHQIFKSVTAPNPLPLPPSHFAQFPTEALKKVDQLLSEYDKEVVDIALRLRHYVTNKLVRESGDPDPKVRLRALEMLGKIKEVGLFVERREVVVSNRSTEELEQELKRKLERFMGSAEVVNVEYVEAAPVVGSREGELGVDAESDACEGEFDDEDSGRA